jgi:hypothetical protein
MGMTPMARRVTKKAIATIDGDGAQRGDGKQQS